METKAQIPSFFERFSIRTKLVAIFSLVVLVSLSLMILLANYFFSAETDVQVRETNHRLAQVIGHKAETQFKFLLDKSKLIATILKENFNPATRKRLINLSFQKDKNIAYLAVASNAKQPNFQYTLYNKDYLTEFQIKETEIEKLNSIFAKKIGRAFTGELTAFNASQAFVRPLLGLGIPFEKVGQATKNILVMYIDLTNFIQLFQNTGLVEAFLVNSESELIVHSDLELLQSSAETIHRPIINALNQSKLNNGQQRYQATGGVSYLGSFRKLATGHLGIIATVPVDKAFAQVQNIQRRNIYILIIVLNTAILAGLWFARRLSKPIISLTDKALRFQERQFKLADIRGKDEIRYLRDSFDTMIEYVHRSQAELKSYAEDLEAKVTDRTQELSDANDALTASKKETDRILENISEGLFLIDAEYRIGNQHSKFLAEILEEEKPAGMNLFEILSHALPAETVEEVAVYLKLLFKPNTNLRSLQKLNPLSDVTVHLQSTEDHYIEKHLSFTFVPIYSGSLVVQALIFLKDVTQAVRLEQALADSEKKTAGTMERMFIVMNVNPITLAGFLEDAQKDIDVIRRLITWDTSSNPDEVVAGVSRLLHTIKGNAEVLALDFIAQPAHDFEEAMSKIRKEEITQNIHRATLFEKFDNLKTVLDEIGQIIDRLASFHRQFSGNEQDILGLSDFENNTTALAAKLGKAVNFTHNQVPVELDDTQAKVLKSALVQLVRNSLKHGIEKPELRKRFGKHECGRIDVKFMRANGHLTMELSDDGRGIDPSFVAERALNLGIPIDNLDEHKLNQLIFLPGFTTVKSPTLTAGRGIGMYAVKKSLDEIGGSIDVESTPGEFCRFHIEVPI